jgi:hypothetical protein
MKRRNKEWLQWEKLVVVGEWMKVKRETCETLKKRDGSAFESDAHRWDAFIHQTAENSKMSRQLNKHVIAPGVACYIAQ